VGVAAPQPRGLTLASRSCHARHLVAPLQPSVDTFVASVAAVAEHRRYDVVFGAGEAEVLALSAARRVPPGVFPHRRPPAAMTNQRKSAVPDRYVAAVEPVIAASSPPAARAGRRGRRCTPWLSPR
jgi:hypothetical protein